MVSTEWEGLSVSCVCGMNEHQVCVWSVGGIEDSDCDCDVGAQETEGAVEKSILLWLFPLYQPCFPTPMPVDYSHPPCVGPHVFPKHATIRRPLASRPMPYLNTG